MAVAHTEYGWWSDLNWSPSVHSPGANQTFNDTLGKDFQWLFAALCKIDSRHH